MIYEKTINMNDMRIIIKCNDVIMIIYRQSVATVLLVLSSAVARLCDGATLVYLHYDIHYSAYRWSCIRSLI